MKGDDHDHARDDLDWVRDEQGRNDWLQFALSDRVGTACTMQVSSTIRWMDCTLSDAQLDQVRDCQLVDTRFLTFCDSTNIATTKGNDDDNARDGYDWVYILPCRNQGEPLGISDPVRTD